MKAIFHKQFSYTSRKVNAGWTASVSNTAQHFPAEFVEAAIAAGCATEAAAKKPKPKE